MKITSRSAEETIEYGRQLALLLEGGQVIALKGELGGGKTQFAKGLAWGLGIEETIVSPTFVIRRDYLGTNLRLAHYDLYRLSVLDEELKESLKEAAESNDTITVIEWAQRAQDLLPLDLIEIRFNYCGASEREILFSFNGERMKHLAAIYKQRIADEN